MASMLCYESDSLRWLLRLKSVASACLTIDVKNKGSCFNKRPACVASEKIRVRVYLLRKCGNDELSEAELIHNYYVILIWHVGGEFLRQAENG